MRKNHLSVAGFLILTVAFLFAGCSNLDSNSLESDSDTAGTAGTSVVENGVTYYYMSMSAFNRTVSEMSSARSVLPAVTNGLYYTVVAIYGGTASETTAFASPTVAITATDYTGAADKVIGFISNTASTTTLKLRASAYYKVTVFGTIADNSANSGSTAVSNAITNQKVTATKQVYVSSTGTLQVSATDSTAADLLFNAQPSAGTGDVSLKILIDKVPTYSKLAVTSIKATVTNGTVTGTSGADLAFGTDGVTTVSGNDASTDATVTLSATGVNSGTYTVDLLFYASGYSTVNEVYHLYETVTVWAGQASTWYNSGTSGIQYDTTNGFELTEAMRTSYKRTIFYVSNAGTTLPAGASTGTGSLFAPYDTITNALASIANRTDSSTFQIVVDGTGAATEAVTVNQSSYTILIRALASASPVTMGSLTLTAGTVTLQNGKVTGATAVNCDTFTVKTSKLAGATTLGAGNYINIASGDTTVIADLVPTTTAINTLVVKHTDTTALTESMIGSSGITLDATVAGSTKALGVDTLTGSTTIGDIIIKSLQTVSTHSYKISNTLVSNPASLTTLTVSGAKLTATVSITDNGTAVDAATAGDISLAITLYDSSNTAIGTTYYPTTATSNLVKYVTLGSLFAQASATTTYTAVVSWTFSGQTGSSSYEIPVTYASN